MNDSDLLIIPASKQELIDLYFDKKENESLWVQYQQNEQNIRIALSDPNNYYEPLVSQIKKLVDESTLLNRRIFQIAFMAFARRICEDQVAICDNEFWNAPCGKESEYIQASQMPDVCTDNKLYNDMMQWWDKLSAENMLHIACSYESEFGPVYMESDDINQEKLNELWNEIPIDDRQRIYDYCLQNNLFQHIEGSELK
ncbi:MAG: hypothetical protein HP046_21015 [Parabacteroides sp.]|nr:hypothetical protein [Parabacteroides sp.]